jgi:hypothetical protein
VVRSPVSSNHLRFSSITFSMVSRRSSIRSARLRSSAMSSVRDSLGSWIDARTRASIEYASAQSSGHVSMGIDEYERRGSWLTDPDRGCGIDACIIHRRQSTDYSEFYNWKYFEASLAAGEAATKRRRTSGGSLAL